MLIVVLEEHAIWHTGREVTGQPLDARAPIHTRAATQERLLALSSAV